MATLLLMALAFGPVGCTTPIGADKTTPALAYRQIHDNPVSHGQLSRETLSMLHRFQQVERFAEQPDEVLRTMQEKAVATRDREMLFVLAELNYQTGENLRDSVKPWEPRDARAYYLASAVYAWLFLFGEANGPSSGPLDQRTRTACDLYNYGLGWAFTERRSSDPNVTWVGGPRALPHGQVEIGFDQSAFPWPMSNFEQFVLADRFVVRGLSVRNRQPGIGAPFVAVTPPDAISNLSRRVPATALLRLNGGLAELGEGRLRATLALYSSFDTNSVQVNGQQVPLETDTTFATAYGLNESWVWKLGMMQFLSYKEQIPTDVYLTQPYQRGKIPVVFVHGTFSSPVWWAEMANTLAGDPELRQRYQFWFFIYNSGNPIVYSAHKLRESLQTKLRELDPQGTDAALQQMVVVGHSQGGLLTKLTATDTGDKLLQAVLSTNRLADIKMSDKQRELVREYTSYEALPFVRRVVFISTPHRGSYLASSFARRLARKFVTLPGKMVQRTKELTGLAESLQLPWQLRRTPTSLDGMSPKNPFILALADIPIAPGVKGNSIIAVEGEGDFKEGKDGLVAYSSAHVDYVESEFIVRSFHSCQDKPPTIEEVRRILHEHLKSSSAKAAAK